MTPPDAYAHLVPHFREPGVLQSCSAVLGWDQQTNMPRGGAGFRGEQLHERATDPIAASQSVYATWGKDRGRAGPAFAPTLTPAPRT